MKIFHSSEFAGKENPKTGEKLREDILGELEGAFGLRGIFITLPPHGQLPLHYHETRESLIVFIKGAGTEIGEGGEFPVKEGDIVYVPAKEKHKLVNTSPREELRYLEFFTSKGGSTDFIALE